MLRTRALTVVGYTVTHLGLRPATGRMFESSSTPPCQSLVKKYAFLNKCQWQAACARGIGA
jgi:hypothetical protein